MLTFNRYFTLRTFLFSAAGAILLAVIETIITDVTSPGAPFEPAHIAVAATIGFCFSAVFERLLEASEVIVEARQSLEAAAQIRLFRGPTELIKDTPVAHRKLVESLLELSVIEGFRDVAGVSIDKYIEVLEVGLDVSSSFSAVQRKPIRWFFENSREEYLERLKQRTMKIKRRVFLIDHNSLAEMMEDLASPERMRAYWDHTGSDVNTFWISVDAFEDAFDLAIPKDLVIFDDAVVIAYDESHRTLEFDVQTNDGDARSRKFFKLLDEQLAAGHSEPFLPIRPVNAVPAALSQVGSGNAGDGAQ